MRLLRIPSPKKNSNKTDSLKILSKVCCHPFPGIALVGYSWKTFYRSFSAILHRRKSFAEDIQIRFGSASMKSHVFLKFFINHFI